MLDAFKHSLTRLGASMSPRALIQVQAAVNYLKVGHWVRERGYSFTRVQSREDVWDVAIARVQHARVLYLEFGVAAGHSMRYWANSLKHPEAMLHGFDSFEGLPEGAGPWAKGQFGQSGQFPNIADPRVRFFKGWFEHTLPDYVPPPHDVLVINMDADLYSSTIYVLRHLRPYFRSGTLLYFDEMNHVEHEPRAFDEFRAETRLTFRALCADRTLAYALFECLGEG